MPIAGDGVHRYLRDNTTAPFCTEARVAVFENEGLINSWVTDFA